MGERRDGDLVPSPRCVELVRDPSGREDPSQLLGNVEILGDVSLSERSSTTQPSANQAKLFARDNGLGKTQLCVRFGTGDVQVLATEP